MPRHLHHLPGQCYHDQDHHQHSIISSANLSHNVLCHQTIEESVLSELLGLVQENAVGTWIEMYGWKVCPILLALLLGFIVSPRLALTTWSLYPARRRSSRRGTSLKRLIWTLLPASWHPATELSHPSNDPNISES